MLSLRHKIIPLRKKESQSGRCFLKSMVRQKVIFPHFTVLLQANFIIAGKDAMNDGVGAFNKAASIVYDKLGSQEKEQLQEKAESIEKYTSIDIRHRAAAVFKKIRNQVHEYTCYFCFIYNTLILHSSENYKNTDIML